jgi:hypothetical protein
LLLGARWNLTRDFRAGFGRIWWGAIDPVVAILANCFVGPKLFGVAEIQGLVNHWTPIRDCLVNLVQHALNLFSQQASLGGTCGEFHVAVSHAEEEWVNFVNARTFGSELRNLVLIAYVAHAAVMDLLARALFVAKARLIGFAHIFCVAVALGTASFSPAPQSGCVSGEEFFHPGHDVQQFLGTLLGAMSIVASANLTIRSGSRSFVVPSWSRDL